MSNSTCSEPNTEIIAYVNVGAADPAIVQNFAVQAAMTEACIPPNLGDAPVCFPVGACAAVAGAPSTGPNVCTLVGHPTALTLGETIVRGTLVPAIGFQPITADRPAPVSFIGWYRGWSVLEWNEGVPFSESAAKFTHGGTSPEELQRRILQLSATDAMTPPIAPPSFVPFVPAPLGTRLQRPTGTQDLTEPVWRGSGIDSFVSATTLKPSRRSHYQVGEGGALQTIAGYNSLAMAGPSLRASAGIHGGLNAGWMGMGGAGSRGEGRVLQEFYDVNGDRLPDSVTWSSAGMRVQFLRADNTFAPSVPFNLAFDSLRKTVDFGHRTSGGLGTIVGLAMPERRSNGWIEGFGTPTPSWGDTTGRNATEVTLADINGDGLVDHLRLVEDTSDPLKPKSAIEAQFNLGHRLGRPVRLVGSFGQFIDGSGVRLLQTGFETEVSTSSSKQFGVYGTGAGIATTERRTLSMLIDVTGDGLPDHVEAPEFGSASEWWVAPNIGAGFGPRRRWTLQSFAAAAGVDPANTTTLSRSVGRNINGSVGGVIELALAVIRLSFQGSASLNSSDNETAMTLSDVNGDGLLDHVAQAPDGRMFARINPIGPANRLARIRNPQGGRIELAYDRAGNVAPTTRTTPDGVSHAVHMPRNQWVLSQVETWDSSGDVPTPGHYSSTSFDYHQSGYYDAAERESYGFGHITVTATDGARSEMYFHNQDYYRRGRLYASVGLDATNHAWSRAGVSWTAPPPMPASGRFSPRKASETSYILDGSSVYTGVFGSIHAIKTVTKSFTYRATGEVESITDPGDDDGNDDLRVEISYKDFPTLNLSLPEVVTVRAWPSLAILRQRSAKYRDNGTLKSISDRLVGGIDPDTGDAWIGDPSRDPTTTFAFDAFGNISETTDPTGFATIVTYDVLTRSRPEEITNSFGLTSSTQYDDRWGLPPVTSR
jgi:YD repeat-containing protein